MVEHLWCIQTECKQFYIFHKVPVCNLHEDKKVIYSWRKKKTNIQQIWIYSKITEPLVSYEYLVYYKIYKDVEVIFFDNVYSTVNGMTIDLISSSLSLHQTTQQNDASKLSYMECL